MTNCQIDDMLPEKKRHLGEKNFIRPRMVFKMYISIGHQGSVMEVHHPVFYACLGHM